MDEVFLVQQKRRRLRPLQKITLFRLPHLITPETEPTFSHPYYYSTAKSERTWTMTVISMLPDAGGKRTKPPFFALNNDRQFKYCL